MTTPPIDTFEHDIVKEIHQKEASIADIASAVGDIGNKEDDQEKSQPIMLIAIIILIIGGIVGVGYLVYLSYQGKFSSAIAPASNPTTEQKPTTSGIPIRSLSPALDRAVGQFLTNAQKTNLGYTVSVVSYSPVFAYMLRNEKDFADDFAQALGNTHVIKNKPADPSPQPILQASSTSTSTPKLATSTVATTSQQDSLPAEYIFSDITLSNQNMRVATSLHGTVAYAFIGNNTLVIASSPEGILSLRSSLFNK